MHTKNKNHPRVRYLIAFLFFVYLSVPHALAQNNPVIFNGSESAQPGDVIGLQGHAFGKQPSIWLTVVKAGIKEIKPGQQLPLQQASDTYCAARLPKELPMGLYAVWVDDGKTKSAPHFINRARVMFAEFNQVMPGTIGRLFGRNLSITGAASRVRFVEPGRPGSLEATVLKANPYEIQLQAPEKLQPGTTYQLYISNGAGGDTGETLFDETITVKKPAAIPFQTTVPWVAAFDFTSNIYNVKTDARLQQHAVADGIANDRAAIQEAIDKAHANGGGVVYLPAGIYKLAYSSGCGLTMRSRVVLKGAGPGKTSLQYGYGVPFSTERVKASYGWTLGWPDSRVEGMGLVFPGGITTSGLVDLTLRNVNESGAFLHTIKNMPEGGSAIILQNCHFDFNTGWGLTMVNIEQLLIDSCTFTSSAMDVRNINAPTRTWPWDIKNSSQVSFRNNKTYYNAGRLGVNGCHHAVLERNLFVRNGDHQAKGETGGLSLDYITDIMVLGNTFEVTGKAIAVRNQGETILSQAGMAHQQTVGRVSAATATSITDARNEYQDFTDRVSTDWQYVVHPMNYSIAIVDGKGTGQWRTITGNSDTSLTIDKPWDVIPAPGSRYVITQWSAWQMIIKDNILKDNNRGIWLYCGGNDIVVTGNQLINSEGIYIRSDQRTFNNRYNIAWNLLVENNFIQNTNGIRPAYIAAWLAQVKADKLWGTGILGLEVKRNSLQAYTPNVKNGWIKNESYVNYVNDEDAKGPSRDTITPGILGAIFQNNKALQADRAYITGAGTRYTTIVDTVPDHSQETAELQALQRYETQHPPRIDKPAPAPAANPDSLGARLIRTATLLATSTPKRRHPVKVLIYGQSITGSVVFTEQVTAYLKEHFPYADISIVNRSIGGFAASQIVRTAPHDLYYTTADLVIFHVYGGEKTGELDTLFSNLRRTSKAEVLLLNHHLNGDQQKPNEVSRQFLRRIADTYQCELVDVSTEWMQYLTDHHLQPKDLLRDNVHPNRHGNWLLARLVGRHIRYDPALSKKYSSAGRTILMMTGPYIITRPSPGPGTWWPAVRRVSHTATLVPEDWTLEITGINADSSVYTFKIYGSVTGHDGSGSSDQPFTSRSGRVVIDPSDIIFTNIKKVFKVPTPVGFTVHWKVVPAYPEFNAPRVR